MIEGVVVFFAVDFVLRFLAGGGCGSVAPASTEVSSFSIEVCDACKSATIQLALRERTWMPAGVGGGGNSPSDPVLDSALGSALRLALGSALVAFLGGILLCMPNGIDAEWSRLEQRKE